MTAEDILSNEDFKKCVEGKPLKDLFSIKTSHVAVPPKAMIEPSRLCEWCGEPTMVSKLIETDGRSMCRECSDHDYRPVAE